MSISPNRAQTAFQSNGADAATSSLPVDTGYLVRFPEPVYSAANAWMSWGSQGVPLWVYEYETAFTLAGSTAQSQMVRTFFPRNFQQPQFEIRCQAPNQFEYNRTAEFVRYMQRKAISTGRPGRIQISGGGTPVGSGTRGLNKGFLAEGWVANHERGGEFAEFAPQFEFGFVISRMIKGLYSDSPVTIRQLKSWAEILKNNPGDVGYVTDPDLTGQRGLDQTLSNIEEQIALGHAWNWVQQNILGDK